MLRSGQGGLTPPTVSLTVKYPSFFDDAPNLADKCALTPDLHYFISQFLTVPFSLMKEFL